MISERAQKLLTFLRQDRSRTYRLLEALVATESPSRDGRSQRAVQGLLIPELENLGYRIRTLPGEEIGDHLLAVPRDRARGEPVQVLVGHSDTVWPLGTLQTMPITQRAGRMTGPGVYDMKGGLAQMIASLRALRATRLKPAVSPLVFINAAEEIANTEARVAMRRLAQIADRVLVLEPAFGRRGKLKTARKGVGHFVVRVRGKAAHAGLEPKKGVSAILELTHVVQKLFALNHPEQGISINVGTVDGGLRPNVVAPESSATVDARVVSIDQAREVEAAIRSIEPVVKGAELHVDGSFHLLPLERTPRNRRLWELATEMARELDLEIEECLAGGGSDGNVASLYAPTLDGLGPIGGGAHASHEFVQLSSLIERGALLALLLLAPPIGGAAPAGPRSVSV